MIIFELGLATFDKSFIIWSSWGSSENWLKFKIETPFTNSACPNP